MVEALIGALFSTDLLAPNSTAKLVTPEDPAYFLSDYQESATRRVAHPANGEIRPVLTHRTRCGRPSQSSRVESYTLESSALCRITSRTEAERA